MGSQTIINRGTNTYHRTDIDGYSALEELALNLRWTWSHGADDLWRRLDPTLWAITQNPWVILQAVSKQRLEDALGDSDFRQVVDRLLEIYRMEDETPSWFQQTHPRSPLTNVGYFSMEYMLSEALPIYSGGLGNVAGDQLKAASDLGVPVTAVGLLFQQGYFRQVLEKNGLQEAVYPYNDPGQLPITPLRLPGGEWLRIEIAFPGYSMWLRTWQVKVGRAHLFLLDSNDPANYPPQRGITSELYGGGIETRLKQELVLAFGGYRLLEALGIHPEVCHLNEGHAAFVVLERARAFMEATGQSFDVALAATRAGNLFTTHTAVPAGFDRFPPELLHIYLKTYCNNRLHVDVDQVLKLGRLNADDPNEEFNMAYLAARGSAAINGVSRLHAQVSQRIFEPLFPKWPEKDIPIGYVTNGVHMPTWDSGASDELWTSACGKDRWLFCTEALEQKIRCLGDAKLWTMRNNARKTLVEYARERLSYQLAARGASSDLVEGAKHVFDPNVLTLGFARRFATYKRPNMLLQDPERLLRILNNASKPVQLIIAGKAHPADKPGQALIQQWIQFCQRPETNMRVIFLSDYDVGLTQHLVRGVDVWLNTPKRPWEACGTSGMKVLVNGGLNLSELDGWWAEAYTPDVGWALGDGHEHGDDPNWDFLDAQSLYAILEEQVIPEFYARDAERIPNRWVARMRESMAHLTPRYNANRAVREYTETYYLPAAKVYRDRSADRGVSAKELLHWQHELATQWSNLRFVGMQVKSINGQHRFEVHVYMNSLDPDSLRVELFANGLNEEEAPVIQVMNRIRQLAGDPHTYVYQGVVPDTRPKDHFTARVVPSRADVAIPLEAPQILWQR